MAFGFIKRFAKKVGSGFSKVGNGIAGFGKKAVNWGAGAAKTGYNAGKSIVNRSVSLTEDIAHTGLNVVNNVSEGATSLMKGLGNPLVLLAVVGGVIILGPRILDAVAGKKSS